MRVISGSSKGRLIRCPVGLGVRPTSEKVREACFDVIGSRVEDAVFYDVFSGTGAMGIEALSRGARWVVFIESSKKVELVMRGNVAGCGFVNRCDIWIGDFREYCSAKAGSPSKETPDIIYLDPPYTIEDHGALLRVVADCGWHGVNPELLVILERPARRAEMAADEIPEPFEIRDTKTYGDTSLIFLHPSA